jgi:hypothetical protein
MQQGPKQTALWFLAASVGLSAVVGNGLTGIVAVLVGANSLVAPIFHRPSAADSTRAELIGLDGTKLWATISCPGSGAVQPTSPAEIRCPRCGCHFSISVLNGLGPAPKTA